MRKLFRSVRRFVLGDRRRKRRGPSLALGLLADALDGFDPIYYLRENPDVARAGADPRAHYVGFGRAEGRFPNAAAAGGLGQLRLVDLCDPERDESGPRITDSAFFISVLTPTYNTEPCYLRELFQTLLNQRYTNWEWVVADDGSTDSRTVTTLRELSTRDSRVRLTLSPKNLGISGASNLALSAAGGTHVALVDHDDLVSRDAFLMLYEAWKVTPSTQLFFTDECKLVADGTLKEFWAKPDWSPAYLENTMCLGHLSVYEARFLRSLGGFRSAFNGTQDFDLALRASLTNPQVVHLPIFAYLWRVIPGSAATDLNEKHYAIERQGKAVLAYARTKHPQAVVVPGWAAGYWRIIYPLPSPSPLLSVIIPTGGRSRIIRGDSVDLILNCIHVFQNQHFYPNFEFVIIHNGDLTVKQTQALQEMDTVRLIHYSAKSFNFSEKLNLGVAAAVGDYLCLLNDDVEVITERGGEELVAYLAANPSVGAIAPMCLFEDGTIQQNGVVLTSVGPAHAGAREAADYGGHQAMMRCRRESFCVGGAIMLLRREVYLALGGFDEALPLNYNDVDFGLRLRERGLACVVDPSIQVYHFEGASKVGTSTVEQERFFLTHRNVADPYFSHWFKQDEITYKLGISNKAEGRPFGYWLDRHIAHRVLELVPKGNPKLSVCVSVYNQPKRLLEEMYNSVMMQTYRNNELVILDNGSSNPETLEWLRRVGREERAIISRSEENLGIEGGNLRLLELMTGDFFVAVHADDFLSIDALQVMAHAIEAYPGRKVFYSDEYKSNINSERFAPFFKPDFDPILFMNCCFPAHLMAMDAKFLLDIEAYTDPRAASSHDYDPLAKALSIGKEPVHVREPIYARRINPGSTASAETFGKPETVDSQRFVISRLLEARGLSDILLLEPNTVETSRGMWRVRATKPLRGIRRFDIEEAWGESGLGVPGLAAAAAEAGVAWIAILLGEDRDRSILELSALAWLDPRVTAVGGLFVDTDAIVRWSGGLFLPGGRLFDPYAGTRFSEGGYHGQLWCQRCVDVVAPTNVLIRADALQRAAARPGVLDADALMTMLGLEAHESGKLVAVTPHLRVAAAPSSLAPLPLDRQGLLLGSNALAMGSRWYDGRLEAERPYAMPGMMA